MKITKAQKQAMEDCIKRTNLKNICIFLNRQVFDLTLRPIGKIVFYFDYLS